MVGSINYEVTKVIFCLISHTSHMSISYLGVQCHRISDKLIEVLDHWVPSSPKKLQLTIGE
jgi:hypothetical protein